MRFFMTLCSQKSPERQRFLHTVEQLMRKMLSYAPVDAACDQMAKKVLEDGLPPFLSEGLVCQQSVSAINSRHFSKYGRCIVMHCDNNTFALTLK